MSAEIDEKELLNDPTISFWLKDQIQKLSERDILDVARDAELLAKVADQRFKKLVSSSTQT